ncbi:HaeII family restriction endonuclease [Helicobacter sp. 23-1046]
MLDEFADFAKSIIGISRANLNITQKAHFYRVGVTNAADRGLDMYANFGIAVQIKHLSLEAEMAQNITQGVRSDKVVIVCKDAEKDIIASLLSQIGYGAKIASIITQSHLVEWYEKALRGKYKDLLGDEVLRNLQVEIMEEFPPTKDLPSMLTSRGYELLPQDEIFKI